MGFNLTPLDVIRCYIKRLAANGLGRIIVFDVLHDLSNMEPSIWHARNAGMHVVVVNFFTVSAFHTDGYYAEVAERIVRLKDRGIWIILARQIPRRRVIHPH